MDIDKEMLINHLDILVEKVREDNLVLETIEEEPYVCGKLTVLDFPKALRISLKIEYITLAT